MSTLPSYKRRRSNIISLSHISSMLVNKALLPQRTLIDFEVYLEVSAWFAWYHVVTNRSDGILPEVHNRLASCDVDFHFVMRDTQFSAINAARQFLEACNDIILQAETENNNNNNNNSSSEKGISTSNQTTTVIGTVRSVESSAISYLSSAYNIPQIASSSTASYLDNKDLYPLLARTAPTNQGDAYAMVLYLKELNVSHVGIFYISDGYGNDFHADVVRELVASNITVLSIQYTDTAIEKAIQKFAVSNFKYVIAILNPGTWRTFIRYAYEYQIIGQPDYFWIFGESSLEFTDPSFRLNPMTETDLATAIHGSAIISARPPFNEIFDQQLMNFSQNTTMQQQYIDQHAEPLEFAEYTFSTPGPSLYQYLTYDAVVALMLATCDMQNYGNNPLSTGQILYEQLKRTEFQGLSGYVSFDPITGTRQSQNILYGIRNILLNTSVLESFQFQSEISSIIHLEKKQIENRVPFVYFSNTTTTPLPLPPMAMNLNLIPTSILVFGLSLCGIVLLVSMFWIIWTLRHRDKAVVKASQPIFLCQICIGTLIITSAIIPMSLQEPIHERGLDIACMSIPWLISMGFVTTFSALFTKTWRLNKLFRNSRNMRRVVIRPRHVVLPLIVLMIINFAVMMAWTIDAPLVWERSKVANYDTFGRSIESVGRCQPSNKLRSTVYLSLVIAIDLSVLLFSNYQAYLARLLPTEFSESSHIAIAMASMLEICLLGIPLLFFTSTDPSVEFVIRSLLASVTSLSILIPIFLPKFIRQNSRERLSAAHQLVHGNSPRRSKIHIAGVSAQLMEHSSDFIFIDSAVAQVDIVDTPMPSPSISPTTGALKITRTQGYYDELEANQLIPVVRSENKLLHRLNHISLNGLEKLSMSFSQSSKHGSENCNDTNRDENDMIIIQPPVMTVTESGIPKTDNIIQVSESSC